MRCCANCFGDRALRNHIIPLNSDSTGACSYCRSANVELVEPIRLGDVFGSLVNIYETDQNGESLVECLKKDWKLFDHNQLAHADCENLLREILNDDRVQDKYSPQSTGGDAKLNSWERLRTELMHENRFFPITKIDQGSLENLLTHLLLYEIEIEEFGIWYRARIQNFKDEKFNTHEMGRCFPRYFWVPKFVTDISERKCYSPPL